ncbi:hypothetical protein Vadar_031992 [Vaccinium darrowii]|uniref:Uncharacterized protein n=1 Tax=Vaccinium darrowii TaxID=229202 RepID=A0ACB7Y4S9_9ERIC|nr:hypothetical protein Vadar_031992 [Vaccinium darrowii]
MAMGAPNYQRGPDKFKQPGKSPNRVSQLYRLFLTLKYIAAIGRYCRLERVDDAMKLFLEMKGKGIRPNGFTYSYLIPTLCLCGKWKEARAMLGEMFDGGFPLYGHGFNLCVLALTNQGMRGLRPKSNDKEVHAKDRNEVVKGTMKRGEEQIWAGKH